MGKTALQIVKDVARRVGLDSDSIVTFSDIDESLDLLTYVNIAYRDLLRALPNDCIFLESDATLTTVQGTQVYSVTPEPYDIGTYAFYLREDDQLCLLTNSTLRAALLRYPKFYNQQGKPATVVTTRNGISLYPIPDDAYSLLYFFSNSDAELVNTTDTFLVPDKWLEFVRKKAQYYYLKDKGLGDYGNDFAESERALLEVLADNEMITPHYLLPDTQV